jgi:hypothetical protein
MKRKSKKTLSESILADQDDGHLSDESNATTTSSKATGSVAMSRTMSQMSIEDSIADIFNQCLSDLEEKRGSTRESALVKLIRMFCYKFVKEEISEGQMDQLIAILLKSIKKDGQESFLSCKLLALIWITFGPNGSIFPEAVSALIHSTKNKTDEVISASALSLGVIAFLEDLDDTGNQELMGMMV